MAGEAGFDIKLQAMEANALTAATKAGAYQAALVLWSGRADPDGNVVIFTAARPPQLADAAFSEQMRQWSR